jgi:hypothetical protein
MDFIKMIVLLLAATISAIYFLGQKICSSLFGLFNI